MKRTPLKRISKKRAAEGKIYSQLRKQFLTDFPYCQAHNIIMFHLDPEFKCGLVPYSEDVHHVEKRGKNYLNVSTWLAVSRQSHIWIEDHKSQARYLGLLK